MTSSCGGNEQDDKREKGDTCNIFHVSVHDILIGIVKRAYDAA